ncbi:deoxyribodipyrimidine photo-lyase [Candidatus Accumulibacter sp. ACC007]|uniref:cryptochrome/photolyase family protein n=1 Tax=Candidatus Accumulibacter sp. ACC007 TaxID=2823333 RepID=UPI0025C2AE82|nr:deoxyribodipyrimidine photo-lyase [Candidatus Accumulibacter sp. ACC007]
MLDSILVWFRRDLRDSDHVALGEALRRGRRVHCAFLFDREILDPLPRRDDRRVDFIRQSLLELDTALHRRGGGLLVRHGWAAEEIPRLAGELGVAAVFANRDYEPQAKRRDAAVSAALHTGGIAFESFKDQAILDGDEVLTQAGRPFTVFSPYKRAWLKRLTEDDWQPGEQEIGTLATPPGAQRVPSLAELGFAATDLRALGFVPGMSGARQLLDDFLGRISRYRQQRDFPALKGVSYLSIHLRFGTVSIRELVARAIAAGALRTGNEGAATWLSELIWRDFYFMILDRFPYVAERAFKPAYDAVAWEQGAPAEEAFAAWCEGRTGYPLVDAAMRQLNGTGYMHNRLRMLNASFLSKDLGIDWRRGEAYFAARLNDFDLAANNGGWQWAASSGCDAQPYFRIFNPVLQSERFDPAGKFIRRYLPELSAVPDRFIHAPWRMSPAEQEACGVRIGRETPAPLVDHQQARQLTLERYAVVKSPAVP